MLVTALFLFGIGYLMLQGYGYLKKEHPELISGAVRVFQECKRRVI